MGKLIRHFKLTLFVMLLLIIIFSSFRILHVSSGVHHDNSLVLLAHQFLHGHISLEPTTTMPLGDISKFNGKYYVYFGPLASIILMPFVFLFGENVPQVSIGVFSLLLSFFAVYKLTCALKFSRIDSLWLSLFFVFSTVLFSTGILNISAYQVEALGVPFVLLALNEYLTKKRFFRIGIFLAAAVVSRMVLILAITFFILEYFQKRIPLKHLVRFLMPVFIACIIIGMYNFIRFGSPVESGYSYNITLNTYPLSKNLEYGYMNLTHLPTNLYSLLVMAPEPIVRSEHGFVIKPPFMKANPWGIAIWYTSPLFLMLLTRWKNGKYTISLLVTVCVLAIPILLYYSIGFSQFGYRYTLDFLPFLYLLLIPTLKPTLSGSAIFLITLGVLFNCFYITSL